MRRMTKMNYFYLNSDPGTYSWNERSVYGKIFTEFDNIIFPHGGWSDIISSVLDMWVDNTIELLQSNSNSTVEFNFMDGPYYFKAFCISEEILEITLFLRDIKVNESPYEISFYNFLSEIIKITSNVLRNEQIENVSSIKKLYKKYKKLKKLAEYKGYQF